MESKKDTVMVVMNVCKMFILIIYTYIYIYIQIHNLRASECAQLRNPSDHSLCLGFYRK